MDEAPVREGLGEGSATVHVSLPSPIEHGSTQEARYMLKVEKEKAEKAEKQGKLPVKEFRLVDVDSMYQTAEGFTWQAANGLW